MQKLLTIAIPTYNRYDYLKKCLTQLIPQAEKYQADVSVLITDNCSTDDTQAYLEPLSKQYGFIHYHRNQQNKGYSGNQINCLVMPESKYIAILCDDDVYTDDTLDTMIPVLKSNDLAFMALNYYGFKEDFRVPLHSNFAPTEDKIFKRAYDIMNYPSVGHYSGLIFRSDEAKQTLNHILTKYDYSYYEKQRGVIFDTACRALSNSELPAYFIGKRVLANFEQDVLDYDSLPHLCIDYYEYFVQLHTEGIINDDDLLYRKNIVLASLKRRSFSSLCNKPASEVGMYWTKLDQLGLITPENRSVLKAIFGAAKFAPTQFLMRIVYRIYKLTKK